MSPQHSNRANLIEGALRCLERLPPERVTARAIAAEAGANLGSIGYHFASKDELVSAAVVEGLDRWLEEIEHQLGDLAAHDPAERLRLAGEALDRTRREHHGLAKGFLGALARAQHDPRVRERFAAGFRKTRPELAALLGLGEEPAAVDAAGLLHSMFVGLLLQSLLDPDLAIEGDRMRRAQARLRGLLPTAAGS